MGAVIANVLMLVGGLTWLGGELYGVHRNATVKRPGNDTTSQWVWLAERVKLGKIPVVRVLVGMFVLSLFGHFMWHGALLP